METFEVVLNIRDKEGLDQIVTKDKFEEYYNMKSCSIDEDSNLQLMFENAWKLTEESKKVSGTKGWKNEEPKSKEYNENFVTKLKFPLEVYLKSAKNFKLLNITI